MRNTYKNFQGCVRWRIKEKIKQLKSIYNCFYLTDEQMQELEKINNYLKYEHNYFNTIMKTNIDYKTFLAMYE